MKNYKCSECKYGSYYNHFANLWACDLIKDKICTIEYLKAHCPLKDNPTLDDEYEKLKEEWEFSFRTEMALHRVAEKELKEKIKEQQSIIEDLKKENEELKKDNSLL